VAELKPTILREAGSIEFARKVFETTSLVRNLRAEHQVSSNRKTRLILKPVAAHDFTVLARLINADPLETSADFTGPAGMPVSLTPLGEVFLPLDGLFDPQAERARLSREIGKLEAELNTVRTKLANPSFIGRAPENVVTEHQRRETDFAARLEQLRERLEAIPS
jgi:valyl-tRNA synthetase